MKNSEKDLEKIISLECLTDICVSVETARIMVLSYLETISEGENIKTFTGLLELLEGIRSSAKFAMERSAK